MTQAKEVYSIKDVMQILRVRRETIESWISAGELTAVDVSPDQSLRRQFRIFPQDLQAFLDKRKEK